MSQFEFGAYRFGYDAPSRISTSTVFYADQGADLPGEPRYQPLPFVSGEAATSGTTPSGQPIWANLPSRCDLVLYQGDDVVIPLYFNNPDITGDDYSTDEWVAQIHFRHSWRSSLLADFSVAASYHVSPTGTDVADVDDEYTVVEMYLPRASNTRWGLFEWEIASYSAMDLSRFPAPPDWDETVTWPPAQALKTWLFGRCMILPRTTTTDEMPVLDANAITLGMNGCCIGPNGMLSTGGNPSIGFNAFGEVGYVP